MNSKLLKIKEALILSTYNLKDKLDVNLHIALRGIPSSIKY